MNLPLLSDLPTARDRRRSGFTLVEMLIVLFIVMLLAAVALPTVRNILLDQKNSRAARSMVSFIDVARSRAIAEGREVGVLVERLVDDGSADTIGGAVSIRLRQLTGVPSYAGESNDAVAKLSRVVGELDGLLPDGTNRRVNWTLVPGVNQATFDASENQLLLVAATMYNSADAVERSRAPIRPLFDRLELPGGKLVTIQQISTRTIAGQDFVDLRFDLREPTDTGSTYSYPLGSRRPLATDQAVKYRIHRSPTRSNTAPLELPKGIVVDLNLSGIGVAGTHFSQAVGNNSISIIFGPDGGISRVIGADGSHGIPTGQLFLCLGDMDGVKPYDATAAEMFDTSRRGQSNLTRDKMTWIVINHATGRPFAAPSTTPQAATVANAITNNNWSEVLMQSRYLARLSDEIKDN